MRPLCFPCCQHICRVHNDEKTQSPILCDWGCLRCVARGLVDLFQSHYWAGKLSGSFRHAQLQSGALAKCSLQSSKPFLLILRLKSWGSVTAKSVWPCQDRANCVIVWDVRIAVLWYKNNPNLWGLWTFFFGMPEEQAPGLLSQCQAELSVQLVQKACTRQGLGPTGRSTCSCESGVERSK